MENIMVVGGGIVGITAALLLKEKNVKNVYLVEKDNECGGLLKSFINDEGVSFDIGTHIPNQTLHKEIDELLFSEITKENWHHFSYSDTGNFFNGQLYDKSQFIYTPSLDENIYNKGLVELLNSTKTIEVRDFDNLLDFCNEYYGPTFTQHIYSPLMRKLVGKSMEELHPNALSIFGLTRLIPGNADMTRNLKKSSLYDQKFAFASFLEGISPQIKYYPKSGGIQLWIKDLVGKMEKSGVKVITNAQVENIEYQNKKINKIRLNTQEDIKVDALVWTAPPVVLMKLTNRIITSKPPEFRTMAIHNYVFNKPFLIKNQYINCADGKYKSFRITLYPNLNKEGLQEAPYNCTVEVLTNKDVELDELNKTVIQELKQMSIVSEDSNVLYEQYYKIDNGFPILTSEVVKGFKQQYKDIQSTFDNVILTGKATGESFFMSDSIISTYYKIKDYLNKEIENNKVK